MPALPSFAELAAAADPPLDLLALALAAEFRDVDAPGALAALDALGAELAQLAAQDAPTPAAEVGACTRLLGATHGFRGDRKHYDDPVNSMLDEVLARRRGLPILLSVMYVEVARRAGIPLAGVGLPGHFVSGHFGATPPLLIDPFAGGAAVDAPVPGGLVRPWGAHEIAMRMLNNLAGSYERRGDLAGVLRAAQLRLALPADEPLREALAAELRAAQARLN